MYLVYSPSIFIEAPEPCILCPMIPSKTCLPGRIISLLPPNISVTFFLALEDKFKLSKESLYPCSELERNSAIPFSSPLNSIRERVARSSIVSIEDVCIALFKRFKSLKMIRNYYKYFDYIYLFF